MRAGHRGARGRRSARRPFVARPAPAKSAALEYRSATRLRAPGEPSLPPRLCGLAPRPAALHEGRGRRGHGVCRSSTACPCPCRGAKTSRREIGYLRLADAEILLVPGEIYPELVMGGIQDPQDAGRRLPGRRQGAAARAAAAIRLQDGLRPRQRRARLRHSRARSGTRSRPSPTAGEEAQYGEVNSVGDRVAPVLAEAFRGLLAEHGPESLCQPRMWPGSPLDPPSAAEGVEQGHVDARYVGYVPRDEGQAVHSRGCREQPIHHGQRVGDIEAAPTRLRHPR